MEIVAAFGSGETAGTLGIETRRTGKTLDQVLEKAA
jgi:hypothetical protein